MRRGVVAVLLLVAAGCRSEPAAPGPDVARATPTVGHSPLPRPQPGAAAGPEVRQLTGSVEPLRAAFEHDQGQVRLVMLFAPT